MNCISIIKLHLFHPTIGPTIVYLHFNCRVGCRVRMMRFSSLGNLIINSLHTILIGCRVTITTALIFFIYYYSWIDNVFNTFDKYYPGLPGIHHLIIV